MSATKSKNPVQSAVARLAEASRARPNRPKDPARIAAARQDLLVAKTERAILEAVKPTDKDYKPISQEERARLAQILAE